MSNLKPSDVDGIVKELEAVAMAKAQIPPDATPLQKYTALFAPIAGDDQLNRSQAQWFLGACVASVAGEFQKGVDPGWVADDIKAIVKQFATMVGQPGAKIRQLYDVYVNFHEPAARQDDLTWDHHRLVMMREKDPAKRMPLLQQASAEGLSVGDLQRRINQAAKAGQDPLQVLTERVARAEASLVKAKAALFRYQQQHGIQPGERSTYPVSRSA